MEEITLMQFLTIVLTIASAIVLLSNAGEKIVKAVKAAKAPNDEKNAKQDARLDELEKWKEEVDGKLRNDHEHLGNIDAGSRVTQRAILALLDHGIDGNNIKQMQDAKEELQNHLINR